MQKPTFTPAKAMFLAEKKQKKSKKWGSNTYHIWFLTIPLISTLVYKTLDYNFNIA